MSYIARLLGLAQERPLPERVPTDEVLPMHLFDDVFYLRSHTLMWTLRFDDVLDADMLGNSLSELFQCEGWRKLGGRLRLKSDGKVEVHIPRPFTPERPPIYFTKEHFNVRMSEHPEASKLPAAGSGPTLFPSPRSYSSLGVGPGAPRKLDDYLYSDLPQFALHVVTFEDGTLVSINFNHIVSDLSGLKAVLDAWQCHLAGKPEEKADFMSVEDGMAPLYKSATQGKHALDHMRLTGWKMLSWTLWLMWDSWWTTYDSQMMCVPKRIMDALVENARNEVKGKLSDENGVPFISEGDILLALSVRLAAHTLPAGSTRPINLIVAVDPRGRAKSIFKDNGAYVQNAPSGVVVSCPVAEAVEMKIGELAVKMRAAIGAQTTEEQLKVTASEIATSMKETGRLPMFGDYNGLLATSSNWGSAKLVQTVDFSRAVVKAGSASAQYDVTWKPGRPVYYHSRNIETSKGFFSTCLLIINGRDHAGNMWVTGEYPAATWSKLADILKSQL